MQPAPPQRPPVARRDVPQDLEAERQVIGSLLLRSDLFTQVSSVLDKEDFSRQDHQRIFDALYALYHEGTGEIEPIRVIHYLRDRSLLQEAGGDAYILRLAESVVAPASAVMYARRVRSHALRRYLVEAARNIQEEATKPYEDESQFLKQVEDQILQITNRSQAQGVVRVGDIKDEFVTYVERLAAARGGNTGLETLFTEFDNLTAGLKPGELIVLAARPGMGKTTFAMNIASNVAIRGKKNVLVYSLEMSRLELLLRLVCAESQFNHGDLKRGNIPAGKDRDILTAIETIFSSSLHIDDTGTLDIWDCIIRSRKLSLELEHRGESLGLIIVDYLQLLSDTEARKLGRQQEVASISRALKQLSKTVGCPVVALSQMNRSVEQRRGDSRPQLSDLRESGAIEQDADIVMFIHRELFSEDESPEALENRGTAEIIIAKHRNGPVDSFRLAFRPEINRFDNLVREPSFG